MKLRFDPKMLQHWAERYAYADDTHLLDGVGPTARARGYLTKGDLVAIGEWKSPRTRPRIASNPADYVEEVTGIALSSTHERVRIEGLQLLAGVAWPTASVILHFCSSDPYPILDFRALWSLGYVRPPHYDFGFWWRYVKFVRGVSQEYHLPMRVIDQALWQYSSERQTRRGV